jgi:hypothetical protein
MNKTYNFVEYPTGNPVLPETKYKGTFRDARNGIICVNPTCDLECYINYIKLLNLYRDSWKSYGYLDLGMIPVVMGPSFLNDSLHELLSAKLSRQALKIYSMPPVSLMFDRCKIPIQDIWVFKEDAAEAMGIPEEEVTTEKLIRWCWML